MKILILLFFSYSLGLFMPPILKNDKPSRDSAYPPQEITLPDLHTLPDLQETNNSQTQIDLGSLKRPVKPPEQFGYYVGLHPKFRWKGCVSISGITFEKITNIKVKKIVLPGVEQHPDEKDGSEVRQRYGQVVDQEPAWFEKIKDLVLKTVVTIDTGRIRTRKLEKSILEEDPRLDLNRERPLGEYVFMIPAKDCPPDFWEKAFITWEPKTLIKALEPVLV